MKKRCAFSSKRGRVPRGTAVTSGRRPRVDSNAARTARVVSFWSAPSRHSISMWISASSRTRVIANPKLVYRLVAPQEVLYRGRVDVDPANHDHVVSSPDDPSGEESERPPAGAGGVINANHISGAVPDDRVADPTQVGDDELALFAGSACVYPFPMQP